MDGARYWVFGGTGTEKYIASVGLLDGKHAAEDEANAQLIACAPELLKAVRELNRFILEHPWADRRVNRDASKLIVRTTDLVEKADPIPASSKVEDQVMPHRKRVRRRDVA